jgi:nickel-dependent lactate racemase
MTDPIATLTEDEVRSWISQNVPIDDFRGKTVLLIVPDATRTAPLPLLFDCISKKLGDNVKALDILVALGTHPPMPQEAIAKMMGIDGRTNFPGPTPQLFNHEWDNPAALTKIGTLTKEDTAAISNGLLSEEVPVEVNSKVLEYDIVMIVGPVFPHEVVGFSGGNKYFFPGVSGPELLNFFHWLGALISNVGIIGIKDTPVRQVVNRSGAMVKVEKRCLAFVVSPDASLYGMFYGTPESAWDGAASLSGQVHIKRKPKPFKQILSCAPPMYDELWVAGKCMYKLEPVVADGGELIIYAPHLHDISITHGENIRAIGYHVRDYFTKQWDKFKDRPWGVLAHSTHVRGSGTFEDGVEKPRVQVTLVSQIPEEVCTEINLGYRDPATIDVESFANREDEGVLLVRKAGEHLYRLEGQ